MVERFHEMRGLRRQTVANCNTLGNSFLWFKRSSRPGILCLLMPCSKILPFCQYHYLLTACLGNTSMHRLCLIACVKFCNSFSLVCCRQSGEGGSFSDGQWMDMMYGSMLIQVVLNLVIFILRFWITWLNYL